MSASPLVLMYHGIATVPAHDDPDNLFVPVEHFREQLRMVREDLGYEIVSEDQYVAHLLLGARLPRRSCLLTFDDGYASVLHHAAPVLAEQGAPAVAYVSPRLIREAQPPARHAELEYLRPQDLVALQDAGVAIGCHSSGHDSMIGMNSQELAAATAGAREEILRLVGTAPRTFAYPFGDHDLPARQAVLSAGFSLAFATYTGSSIFSIPRVDINTTDTPRTFRLKCNRLYPAVRKRAGSVAGLRRLMHQAVGYADRV